MKHGLYARDNSPLRRAHAREFRRWVEARDAAERAGVTLRIVNWNNGRPRISVTAKQENTHVSTD
jgi:hypothetical protein